MGNNVRQCHNALKGVRRKTKTKEKKGKKVRGTKQKKKEEEEEEETKKQKKKEKEEGKKKEEGEEEEEQEEEKEEEKTKITRRRRRRKKRRKMYTRHCDIDVGRKLTLALSRTYWTLIETPFPLLLLVTRPLPYFSLFFLLHARWRWSPAACGSCRGWSDAAGRPRAPDSLRGRCT